MRRPRAMSRVARCTASSGRLQRPAIHQAASTANAMAPTAAHSMRRLCRCRNRASKPSGSGSAVNSTKATSCPCTFNARVVWGAPGGWGRPASRCPCKSRMNRRSPKLPRPRGCGGGGRPCGPSARCGGSSGRADLPLNSSIRRRSGSGSSRNQRSSGSPAACCSTSATKRINCSSSRACR